MRIDIKISNVTFGLFLDECIARYFYKRVPKVEKKLSETPDVRIICNKQEKLSFTDIKFLHQQEPDIEDQFYYREIFDLGIFKYRRKEKILDISYINTDEYPYDSFEVVVDTLLQFIYLIMLDFDIIPLHTSVVTYGDKALLLFGDSGSGKTTLELSLLSSGFQFFSDDIAFLTQDNSIYSSGEQVVAYSKNTADILNNCFNTDSYHDTYNDMTRKYIINVHTSLICHYQKVKPFIIIFPTLSEDDQEPLEIVSAKSAWLELIRLSISEQFSSLQKQLYMKRLKSLSGSAISFRYYRTNKKENRLKEICDEIKTFCMTQEGAL